ncbi:MAG: ATPase [Nanoarchaeota archaeon]|nr:ATPase [Nanoarchaeota archaeon]|tara:strand:+ start:1223 stop:2737 length:1515 start_codon:yes stop_codon:yes gene_type:complete
MIKGQVISGEYGKILIRQKSSENIEIGELLVAESNEGKYLLQAIDLTYGSQISQQNLEMVSGLHLEESEHQFLDNDLRNYNMAHLKPVLFVSNNDSRSSKSLPTFFSKVREITVDDLSFITKPKNPFHIGQLRSGSRKMDVDIFLAGRDVFSHHVLIPATTGKGKSNLMSCILWDTVDKDYCGMLVLDPHDEYYGRNEFGLKDHLKRERVSYYTLNPPVGAVSLKINLSEIKPGHFKGVYGFSEPQRQALSAYYRRFGDQWISAILRGEQLTEEKFYRETLDVVKRTLMELMNIDVRDEQLYCSGVFDAVAGENTINNICKDLENAKTVIIDTSSFSGTIELLIGSLISSEIFRRYKSYKNKGLLADKPVVAIVLEEAPRVLGKKVLEQGSNVFESIAREGRKFLIGLVAITQLPSEIPKNILANMNTKIILGIEMNSERQAVIESSPQDLSQDNRSIASLDKGEAIVTSTFTKFAVPIKIPLFSEFVKKDANVYKQDFSSFTL